MLASSPAVAQEPAPAEPAPGNEAPATTGDAPTPPDAATDASPLPQAAVEQAILAQTNAVRTKRGLAPLKLSRTLGRAARSHSTFLANTGSFQHESESGAPFWQRLVAAGYPKNATMAENIAQTYGCATSTGAEVVGLWMNSPPHRANLLNPKLRAIGVGALATAGCDEIYVTADYGSVR